MAIVMYAISAVGLLASVGAFIVFARDDAENGRLEREKVATRRVGATR